MCPVSGRLAVCGARPCGQCWPDSGQTQLACVVSKSRHDPFVVHLDNGSQDPAAHRTREHWGAHAEPGRIPGRSRANARGRVADTTPDPRRDHGDQSGVPHGPSFRWGRLRARTTHPPTVCGHFSVDTPGTRGTSGDPLHPPSCVVSLEVGGDTVGQPVCHSVGRNGQRRSSHSWSSSERASGQTRPRTARPEASGTTDG